MFCAKRAEVGQAFWETKGLPEGHRNSSKPDPVADSNQELWFPTYPRPGAKNIVIMDKQA